MRSLLRVKSLQDEVRRQADELKDWNAKLEERVAEQVAQMQRLSQLKRFFSPKVADAIIAAGESSILAPHRREICYVFVDLRGFTAFTDHGRAGGSARRCSRDYHAAMGAIANAHEGTIDRFAGDGILIFFNDPFPVREPGKRAARDGARDAGALRAAARSSGWRSATISISASASRRATRRSARSASRAACDYSAIGSVVNLADRLCGEAHGGQILIDRRTRAGLGDDAEVETVGPLTLKGYAQPVPAFLLKGLK